MTCLCDLLDEIYLYWLLKEEGSWKVKVMCSRETRTVLEFGELWKNNGLAISISESRITQSMWIILPHLKISLKGSIIMM